MKTRNISEIEFVTKVFPRTLNKVSGFDMRFAPNVIKPNTLLRKDLNLDSCDTMQIIVALEEKYNISLSNVFPNNMVNVGDVYKSLKTEVSHKQRIEKLRAGTRMRSTQIRMAMKFNQFHK